jgi:hypothetical protein
MVEESKDGGRQGFERDRSLKLVVRRLFDHSDAKLCHCFSVCTKFKEYKIKVN